MRSTARRFRANARAALNDAQLQAVLHRVGGGFAERRARALAALPEYEQLRAAARAMKDHTLAHLDRYLEHFEARVEASGGAVHWARDDAEACAVVARLCRADGARRVAKAKSMVGEEIGLNAALQAAGLEVIETDLGEYIIQLADEPPSHIIAPAIHKNRGQIAALFHAHHPDYAADGARETIAAIVDEARQIMRARFLSADVGITGANLLVAETGSAVVVTNEGNADLSAALPRTHIVVASIEKVIPTLEDASVILRLLARSATGQATTAYTSWFTGPRREGDPDGPVNFHVVLVDNGRSAMLGSGFRDMLRCIRCGACLNHCPVYGAVGGHAYGWVYPGPMGAVLTPLMVGLGEAGDLPNASTLCGRCAEVCPMDIPLPDLLRRHRTEQHARRLDPARARWALALWAFCARRPRLYRGVARLAARMLARLGGRRGRLRRLPLARGWTDARDLPAPEGETFMAQWRRRVKGDGQS